MLRRGNHDSVENGLMTSINSLLIPPVGPPSHKPNVFYESFSYQVQCLDFPEHGGTRTVTMEWANGRGWRRRETFLPEPSGLFGYDDDLKYKERETPEEGD